MSSAKSWKDPTNQCATALQWSWWNSQHNTQLTLYLRQTNKFIVFAGGLKTSDPENDFDLAPVPDHPRGECALRSRGGCEISHIKSHFASGSPTKCMICHCMAHNRISLRNIHCIFNTTFIRHVLQFIFGYSMFIADQGIISKTHKMLVSHR